MKNVFVINGFLEAGKTEFIKFTISQPYFQSGGTTLLILCEEGEVELDIDEFASDNVVIEVLDSERKINPDKLSALLRKHKASQIVIEYNGMWQISTLFNGLREGWFIEKEILFMD